jgi:hypothetical protein
MDDQDRIKYLEIIERVLVNEWTKTQEPDSKAIIEKIRKELQRLRSTASTHPFPLIFHPSSEIPLYCS